ncbi:MAG: hypothetical protein JW717_07025 [Marinilabiliaceae bacterium]|nr:hypothetical protein [Marinilabiliaceae bacterium]
MKSLKTCCSDFFSRQLVLITVGLLGAICLNTVNAQFNDFVFKNLTVDQGLSQNTVTCIGQDSLGFMWFGTFSGLNRFDGYRFKTYRSNHKDSTSLSIDRCINIYTDKKGLIWVRTIDSIFNRYNYLTDNFERYSINEVPQYVVDNVRKQYDGEVFEYGNHQFHFQREKDRYFTYINLKNGISTSNVIDFNNPNGIHDNYITSLFVDKYNMLWIGTFSSGLYVTDLSRKKFKHFYFNQPTKKNDNNIRAIYQDEKNYLWLGTRDNGIVKLDPDYKIVAKYEHNPNIKYSVNSNDIRKIFKDSKGRLWIGMRGGISMYDETEDCFVTIMKGSSDNIQSFVFNIYEDSKGNIWFATLSGLGKYDELTRSVIKLGYDDGVDIHPQLRAIEEDRNGNLWIASEVGGVVCLSPIDSANNDGKKYKSVKYLSEAFNNSGLSDNRVYCMDIDRNGNLWIGTGAGLNRFNINTHKFDVIKQDNGLTNDMIMGILFDAYDHIWVSHKRGISKVNINNLNVVNYSKTDGLQSSEFNEDAYFINNQTGEMFFGGPNGLTRFYPHEIASDYSSPKAYITDLSINGEHIDIGDEVNGKVILTRNIIYTNKIDLSYLERSFSIGFTAINYSNIENITFEYMLEGFDKNWIVTDAFNRRAYYTSIEAGTYSFLVRARNSEGIWTKSPALLEIKIKPPFWKTPLFQICIVLFGGFLIFMRIHTLRRQKIMLEKRVEERTKELSHRNEQVANQLNKIKEQNKTIVNNHEEILAQSEQLLEQKQKIEAAYNELSLYRNKLEILVKERTNELNKAKKMAEESDRLKSSFLANLSHEVRTPLNAIIGFTSLIFENDVDESEKREYKMMIDQNSADLLKLIESIVDFSMLEASTVELNKNEVTVNYLMSQFSYLFDLELNRDQVGRKNNKHIEFRMNKPIDADQITIYTDSKRVIQVISQLINNAVKYTKKGFVEVGCYLLTENDRIRFYVKDSGVGISKQDQIAIFNSFTKNEFSNKELYRGVGIGLSIALQLVRLLDGDIRVESEPGKGSNFYFDLPLH